MSSVSQPRPQGGQAPTVVVGSTTQDAPLRRRPGPVLLSEVARHARVSLATASRVVNGSERMVSEPLRERVLRSAEQLGYRANAHAQAIARGASNIVGLIVHDVGDPYFSTIASGIMDQAEARGLVVLLAATKRDPDRETEYVATLRSQRARAVIIVGSRTTVAHQNEHLAKGIEEFVAGGGRGACISQDRLRTHTVLPQNRSGAGKLSRELYALGHRRFVVLAGPSQLLTAKDRWQGFRDGLVKEGVPKEAIRIIHGAFTRDGGYAGAQELADEGIDASCLFAVNDVMAVGAMAAFRDAGIRVPTDVSVAGFDDIETLRDLSPSLTTVRLPLRYMGEMAVRLALDSAVDTTPQLVRVTGEVILRESTRKLA